MTAARALATASAVRVQMLRRPQSGIVIVDIEPRIHARRVVVRRNQAGEGGAALGFKIRREAVVAPCLAERRRGAGAVALRHKRLGQREMPFDGVRRLGAEEADDRLRVDALFPHHAFGAAAQRRDARPARIGGDEIDIAREIRRAAVAAQDHPFHELAGERIGNRAFDIGRVVGAILADKIDRLLDGGDVQRRGR